MYQRLLIRVNSLSINWALQNPLINLTCITKEILSLVINIVVFIIILRLISFFLTLKTLGWLESSQVFTSCGSISIFSLLCLDELVQVVLELAIPSIDSCTLMANLESCTLNSQARIKAKFLWIGSSKVSKVCSKHVGHYIYYFRISPNHCCICPSALKLTP